jgi:hypothetical protein
MDLKYVVESHHQTQFQDRQCDTGICKPSIFEGLHPDSVPDIPSMFTGDLIHLLALNTPDLLIGLWRGTIDCDVMDNKASWDWAVLKGQVWKVHGDAVADCTPYLPGSFDRPPRNPTLKISSGYKAWEFLMYLYGLGPALLFVILPERYWRSFCKLVFAVRLLYQRSITKKQLQDTHSALMDYTTEFKTLYCQRHPSRIHFCRQSVHALSHIAPETARVGPGIYYSQWPMERTIGNLGEEIKQPSNPYINLSERAVRCAQTNALKTMAPELDRSIKKKPPPRGSIDLEDDYVLLRAQDTCAQPIHNCESDALRRYLETSTGKEIRPDNWNAPPIVCWARLGLPNGQIACSSWKEARKPLDRLRMAHNVKVSVPFLFFH